MSKWYYHKQQDNKWTCMRTGCMLYAHYICTRLTFLSIFLHHCIVHFSNRHVSKVILNTKRVLKRRKTATLDKHTAERPDNIKTRHVKIIRYLQSWIAMSIDFEQQISHNAFRLLYARKSKPYSHAHTCATTRGKIIAERLKWTKNWRILIEVFSLFQNFSTTLCDVKMRPRNIGNNFQFWFTPCMQRRSNQMHLSNL